MYLSLGDIIFEATLGFESFSDTVEATYAQHELINGKPRLQRTGDTLREFAATISLHSSFCSPEEQYGKLEAKRVSGEFLPLVYGNGTYEGNFVIKSISRVINQTDGSGNYVSITCNIVLLEADTITSAAQQKEQAVASAFARTSNRPLPTGANVNNASNPALSVMNENKKTSQGVGAIADKLEEVDKAVVRATDPMNVVISQAQAFFEMAPSVTAKLNRYANNVQRSLDSLTSLIGANPVLNSVAPALSAQVTQSKVVLISVQAIITEIGNLPSVSSMADALYVLSVQKNSLTLGRQLADESAKLNTASSGVAAALACKVKV